MLLLLLLTNEVWRMWLYTDSVVSIFKIHCAQTPVAGCVDTNGRILMYYRPFTTDLFSKMSKDFKNQFRIGGQGQLQRPQQTEKQTWIYWSLGVPRSDCSSQQHRQDRWQEFVQTRGGCMDRAEWGRSNPVLHLCGWECRGRCLCAKAYGLLGKQDLNWAAAWGAAAHWPGGTVTVFLPWTSWKRGLVELHTNSLVQAIAPCNFNGMV